METEEYLFPLYYKSFAEKQENEDGNLMFDLGKYIFKVIRWFCIAHLLLRITRWPP